MTTRAILNPVLRCLLFPLTCCSMPEQQVEVRSTTQHQTSHIYNMPVGQLKETIIAVFEDANQINSTLLESAFHYRFQENNDENSLHQVYFTTETKTKPLLSEEYFQSGNKNDVYLHAFGAVWDSPVYYANNESLKFGCEFAFRLDSIDSKRTRVTIEVQHPQIINGTVGIGPHGPVARRVAVKPTTVEEWTLLRYLALEVGDTSKIK